MISGKALPEPFMPLAFDGEVRFEFFTPTLFILCPWFEIYKVSGSANLNEDRCSYMVWGRSWWTRIFWKTRCASPTRNRWSNVSFPTCRSYAQITWWPRCSLAACFSFTYIDVPHSELELFNFICGYNICQPVSTLGLLRTCRGFGHNNRPLIGTGTIQFFTWHGWSNQMAICGWTCKHHLSKSILMNPIKEMSSDWVIPLRIFGDGAESYSTLSLFYSPSCPSGSCTILMVGEDIL